MGSVKPAFRADLDDGAKPGRGRHGLSSETVLRCTRDYVASALPAVRAVESGWSRKWAAEATAYLELLDRVADQTERRVFKGETVPAGEKVVSLFEPHTDIIRKSARATR